MDALTFLKQQHREVEKLFEMADKAESDREKESIFLQIADDLAIHATLEEKIFYPAVLSEKTDDLLQEALQEHLQAKRLLADMLDMDPADKRFEAKMKVLKEEIEHHVEEEEDEMFVKVKKEQSKEQLEELGLQMEAMWKELKDADLMEQIPNETKEAPSIE